MTMARKRTPKTPKSTPAPQRSLKLEALEPRILMTAAATNTELAERFEQAIHAQLDSWSDQVTEYAKAKADGTVDWLEAGVGDLLQEVSSRGEDLADGGAVKLKDLLHDTIDDSAKAAVAAVKTKVHELVTSATDMTTVTLKQVAQTLGTETGTDTGVYEETVAGDWGEGVTLVRRATLTGTEAKQTLTLSLHFQSEAHQYKTQALKESFAKLGVQFQNDLQLQGQGQFDVAGQLTLERNFVEVERLNDKGEVVKDTVLDGFTATSSLQELGADFNASLKDVGATFDMGILKFNEETDATETADENAKDLEVRLQLRSVREGKAAVVTGKAEVAVDLEATVTGELLGYTKSQSFDIKHAWSTQDQLTLGDFGETFGGFHKLSSGDIVAQLQKIQTWISSMLTNAPTDKNALNTADFPAGAAPDSLASQLNALTLSSRLDSAASFARTFQDKIFANNNLVETNGSGQVTEVLFSTLDELETSLKKLGVMKPTSTLTYANDIISMDLEISGDFLDADLPASFKLLDGTVAKVKSNSDFEAKGHGDISFTLQLNVGPGGGVLATGTELNALSSKGTDEKGNVRTVAACLVDLPTLQASQGQGGEVVPSGVLSRDARFTVVVVPEVKDATGKITQARESFDVVLPEADTRNNTSLANLATDLQAVINAAAKTQADSLSNDPTRAATYAQGYVVNAVDGALQVTHPGTKGFEILASDNQGSFAELRLNSGRALASLTADTALGAVSATTAVTFTVTIDNATYTVTSDTVVNKDDGEGVAGLVSRINRGLNNAMDGGYQATLLDTYGIKASLGAQDRIVLTANRAVDADDTNRDKASLPFTLANAKGLGFASDTAQTALLTVAGREMISLGRLSQDLTVALNVDGKVYSVSLLKLDLYEMITAADGKETRGKLLEVGTNQNTTLTDLQKQLQAGFDAQNAGVEVKLNGDVFAFQARNSTSTLALDATASKNIDQLGFKDEVSSTADLKIFYQDGSTGFIDLNLAGSGKGAEETLTIQDVITCIEEATKFNGKSKLEVSIAQVKDSTGKLVNSSSLVIRDTTDPKAGTIAGILSWNGSSAAKLLGIEGLHIVAKADIDEAKKNGAVSRTGDGIIGTSVADRISVKNFKASAQLELDVPSYTFTPTIATVGGVTTLTITGNGAENITAKFGGQYVKIDNIRYKIAKVDDSKLVRNQAGVPVANAAGVSVIHLTGDFTDTLTTALDGSKPFVIEGVQISATLGPVGVHLIGRNGNVEGSLGRSLSLNFKTDETYKVSELLKAFSESTVTLGAITQNGQPVSTKMVFDVVAEGLSLPGNIAGTVGLEMKAGSSVPVVTTNFTPLNGVLDNLKNLTSDDILAALDTLIDTLQEYAGSKVPGPDATAAQIKEYQDSVFNQKIPGIDKSINEMVDIVQDIKATVDEIKASGKGDLLGIVQLLRNRLGLTDDANQITGAFKGALVAKVESFQKEVGGVVQVDADGVAIKEQFLKFHLVLNKSFSEKDNLSFNQEGGIEVGGSAELYASGSVKLDFKFGLLLPAVTLDANGLVVDRELVKLVIEKDSFITATLDVGGDNLKFNLGLSGGGILPLSDLIEVGGKDGNKPSFFKAHVDLKANTEKEIRIGLSTAGVDVVVGKEGESGNAVDLSLNANLGAVLPVYVVGSYQGEIKLGEWTEPGNDLSIYDGKDSGTVKALDKGKVDLDGLKNLSFKTFANAEEMDKGAVGYDAKKDIAGGAVTLDVSDVLSRLNKLANLSDYNLFEKIKLAVDGLDMALGGIQDQLEKKFSDRALDMPILGDALANGADFVADLRDKFLDPFRNFVEAASNIDENTVANFLSSELGSKGLNLLGSWSGQKDGSGKVLTAAEIAKRWGRNFDKQSGDGNIAYRKLTKAADTTNGAEWAFHLTGSYGMGTNFGLDLGIPGLGLKTTGGVDADLTWTIDLGFGISESKGFYLILPEGDEVSVKVEATVDENSTLTGALGFLGLEATNPDIEAFVKVGLDLNNMQGKDAQNKAIDNAGILGYSSLGTLRPDITVEAGVDVNLDMKLGIASGGNGTDASFPDIGGRFEFQWVFAPGSKDTISGIRQAGFENVTIDLGQYLTNVLQPVARQIKKITDPIQPLVDFLTTPFPVLRDIGLRLTPLDLAKAYSKGKINAGMIESIADLAKMANLINNLATSIGNDGKIALGDFFLVGSADGSLDDNGNPVTGKKGSGKTTDAPEGNQSTVLSGKASAADVKVKDLLGANGESVLNGIKDKMLAKLDDTGGKTFGKQDDASSKNEKESKGLWTFPIIQDPSQIFGLLMGRDATLVHYTMAPLSFTFDWSQYFPIVGPIGARVGVNLGADIRLAFGYDTLGIREFVKHDFKKPLDLIDGFYVDDNYGGNIDVPEVSLHGGLTAAAELNLGIASGGVGGGVGINVDFDMFDPNHDGKVRLGEMYENVVNEAKYGNALKAPFAIFDIHGKIYAELFAYLNTFWHDYRWQITSPITIAEFDINFTRAAKMANVDGDTLLVNVGDLSGGRLNGDITDGDEQFVLAINGNEATLSSSKFPASGQKYDLTGVSKIRIDSGKGGDRITVTGSSALDIEILGGTGNDVIDLSEYTVAAGGLVVVKGQEGDDVIKGPAIDTDGKEPATSTDGQAYLFGDDGSLIRNSAKVVIGAQGTMNSEGDGIDAIVGKSGRSVIFGGGGSDFLAGGSDATANFIFGDEGRILFKNKDTGAVLAAPVIDRTQLHDGGGDDTVVGGVGDDLIYGGTGNDKIDGGAGADVIYGEKGNDQILGGSGGDTIDGGIGQDIVFGDRISGDVNLAAIFPVDELPKDVVRNVTVAGFAVSGATADSGVAGDDTIKGGQGSDILFGDDGAFDSVTGGIDTISGGLDNDLISGDGGNDTLTGEVGNDVLYGGAGSDAIEGGAGDDIVYGGSGYRGLVGVKKLGTNDASDERVYGGNRADFFAGNAAASVESNDGDDAIQAGLGSDSMDGQGGNDRVFVNLQGGNAKSVTNVADSGASAQDRLTIAGTVGDDDLLMRASATGGLGFVALLPQDGVGSTTNGQPKKSNLERVNFWQGGVDNLLLDASLGNDKVSIDGTVAKTTVDLGGGKDTVTIGQLYASDRTQAGANLAKDDVFATTSTTEGFLSAGATQDLVVKGGNGNDEFNVLANSAQVALDGGKGDDTFAVSSFVRESDKTGIAHGAVSIDGGEGKDAFTLGGGQGDDKFFVTGTGIQSTVGKMSAAGIESTTVVAGAGDDTFHVLGTANGTVTRLEGGLGNDTVDVGGLQDGLSFAGTETDRYTSGIAATVTSSTVAEYAVGAVTEQAVKVIDASSNVQPVFVNATGTPDSNGGIVAVDEDSTNTVGVMLSRDLADGETYTVTLLAPLVDDADAQFGGKGILLSGDGSSFSGSLALTFTKADNGKAKVVTVKAEKDDLYEGDKALKVSALVATGSRTALSTRQLEVDVTDKNTAPQAGVFAGTSKTAIIWKKGPFGISYPVFRTTFTPSDSIDLTGQSSVELAYEIAPKAPATALTVKLNGTSILEHNPKDDNETGLHYILDGKRMLFWDAGLKRVVGQTGKLEIENYALLLPADDAFGGAKPLDPAVPQVQILPLHGELNVVEGARIGDSFLVKLSEGIPAGQSVTVSLAAKSFGDGLERAGLTLDKTSVTFDGSNNAGVVVRVVAANDGKRNTAGQEYVGKSPNNFGAIQGAVFAEGEGNTKAGAAPKPVLLRQLENDDTDKPVNEKDISAPAAGVATVVNQDDRASTDRILFNGKDETADRTSKLSRVLSTEAAEIEDLEKLTALEKETLLAEKDFARRMDAMRFTQNGVLPAAGITYGDFELAEVDLGTGKDTVTVEGAVNRRDGFRTVTILNTGNETGTGDNVTISSYQAEVLTTIGTGTLASVVGTTITAAGDVTGSQVLAGFQLDVTNADGSVQRRTIISAAYDSASDVTKLVLDRELATDSVGLSFAVVADVRQNGVGLIADGAVVGTTVTLGAGTAVPSFASMAGAIQAGDLLELVKADGKGNVVVERRSIVSVGSGTVTVDSEFASLATSATSYRVWRRADGLLAVNLQDGDDKITSTSGAVTASLIAFGGLGKDTITTGASAYAFGDRGQIRYASADGTVTLLGTADDGSDYTTEKTLGELQTDGVGRSATSFKTLDDTLGADDTIVAAGADSVIFGGAGTDTLTVTGEHNFVFGDAGKVDFVSGGTSAWGDRQSQDPVSASTTNDEVGARDVITITGGRNTVLGGAGNDEIHVNAPETGSATGDNTVLGDGGSVVWENGLVKSVTTTSNTVGDVDEIHVAGDGNRVMGGAAGDTIEITGGNNTVLGDGGEALWNGGVLASVKTVDDSVGGVDIITVGGKRNAVMGGAAGDEITLLPGSDNGDNTVLGDGGIAVWENGLMKSVTTTNDAVGGVDTIKVVGDDNRVMAGADDDKVTITGGKNVVMGDGGEALWDAGVLQSVKTTSDEVGGVDEITVNGGGNVAMGGAAGDTLTLTKDANGVGGDNTVLGDGGIAVWENGLVKSVTTTSDAIGGVDKIAVEGDDNRVMAGADDDKVTITGGKNVVMGDGGEALWNAGVLQSVQTTSDAIGGKDVITVIGGRNVAMGGAAGDTLTIERNPAASATNPDGDNTVLGDGGKVLWENGLVKTVQTTSDAIGGIDKITVNGDVNRVMGGADNDEITINGDRNVALGDGGVATWNAGVLQTVSTTSDDIGGNDKITINGGTNVVMGGNGQDVIGITGSDNVALGDGGTVTYRTNGNLQRVQTKSDNLGGSDVITTGDGANIAFGGFAADVITTGAGDDVIVGDGGFADFDVNGQKLLVSNEGQALGGNDLIDAGIGLNTVMGGMGDDRIVTGIKRDSDTADARDAWANDKDVVLGDNGSRTFQGTGTAVDGRTAATLSFNFQGGYGQGMTSSMLAGANGYRSSNWNNLSGIGASTYGNDASEIVRADNGQRLEGLDLSWGGKEGHRTPSIETNGYTLQNYDPNRIKDANGAAQLGDGLLFAGGVRTTAPNSQSDNKLEVEMAGLSKYFKSYSVVVYLDASSEVSSLIQNPQDSTLAKQLGKTTGESIRKVNVASGSVNDSYFLDDASSSSNQSYNTFNGSYVKAFAKDAASAYGKYANYVVFEGLTDDRFVVTITDGVLNVNYNGRDLPSIAGIQIIGQYWPTDTIKSSTTETGGNDVISTGGGSDVVIGGAGSDAIATFGDVRHGVNDADTVIGDNGTVSEMVRAGGLAAGTSVVQAVATGFAAGTNLTGATFNDVIVTGNGNDVVIGGDGQDRINTERQDDLDSSIATVNALDVFKTNTPEALKKDTLELLQNQETSGLKVLSLNMSYSYRDSNKDDSQLNVADKQYAGAVAAKNWNNVQLQDELSPVQYANPYTNKSFLLNDGTAVASGFNMNFRARDVGSTGNPTSVQADRSNGQEQIDPDSENAKLFKSSLWVQQQQQLEVNLNGIKSKAGFDTYDVYVYIDGDNERTDADNWIYEVKGTNLDNGKSDTNYLNDWRGNTFNGEFRRVTAKNTDVTKIDQSVIPNRALIGNYVVFENVTAENFQVILRNHKVGSQSPMNQPSIAGIQIVGKTNVAANQKNLPLNGDYDKDVVLGDNGKVNLTVDVPYGYDASPDRALNPLQNKAYEAISDVTSKVGGSAASQSDVIVTGRNQDIVLGGNGSDAIDAGSGDDMVLGDNGIIQMSDYNPIGVRQPLNLKMVDATQTDNATYIGKAGFNRDQFVQKLQNGQVPGVQSIASSLSGNDVVDAGKDNDLVLGQEGDDTLIGNSGTDDVLYDTVGSNKVKDVAYATQPAYLQDLTDVLALLDAEGQGLLKGDFSGNDFGKTMSLGSITKGLGSASSTPATPTTPTTTRTIAMNTSASSPITVQAGEEIILTASAGSFPTSGNVGLSFGANGATIPAFTLAWLVNGATQTANVAAGQWYVSPVREIPDSPNDNGRYTIRLKAATAGSFTVTMTNW
jgi:Ca2+-binding RTX toxin-like protein